MMLSYLALIHVLAAALEITALPANHVSAKLGLPIASKLNSKGSENFSLATADRARIEAMVNRGHAIKNGNSKRARAYSVDATNAAVSPALVSRRQMCLINIPKVVYTSNVTIGSEGEQYTMLVDTGQGIELTIK
jgi:hypothetical protein